MVKNRDLKWVYKFEQIQIFREIFGHCIIPQRYHKDPALGSWVSSQRFFLKNLGSNFGRNILLKKLEFTRLSPKNFYFFSLWNKHYLELRYYKKVYGHCNVPGKFNDNNSLGFWVKNQRQLLKKSNLESYKVGLLYQLGFEWKRGVNFSKISWLGRYEDLFDYFKTKGDTFIPQRHGSTGKWVQRKRSYFKNKKGETKKSNLFLIIKFFIKPSTKKNTFNFYKISKLLLFKSLFELDFRLTIFPSFYYNYN